MVALGGDAGAIHAPNNVAFDTQTVLAARHPLAFGVKEDSAIVLPLLGAVDVVDEQVRHQEIGQGATIVGNEVHPAARMVAGALICDFQIVKFDMLGVPD